MNPDIQKNGGASSFFQSQQPLNTNYSIISTASSHPSLNHNNNNNGTNQEYLIRALQDDLKAAEEEIEDLEMEMISLLKEKDKTPGSILFFSLLNDASFIPNLQQLLIQFKFLKQFLDYSISMDYVTLRKRLQVCLVIMPSIDKLIEKYSKLYKQWSFYRLNWFHERKIRGSASDGMHYCPLCYNDLSEQSEESKKEKQHLLHQHHHQRRATRQQQQTQQQHQQQQQPLLQLEGLPSPQQPLQQVKVPVKKNIKLSLSNPQQNQMMSAQSSPVLGFNLTRNNTPAKF
jgi:uncharacterized Zn finger protein (UPF0148 family)